MNEIAAHFANLHRLRRWVAQHERVDPPSHPDRRALIDEIRGWTTLASGVASGLDLACRDAPELVTTDVVEDAFDLLRRTRRIARRLGLGLGVPADELVPSSQQQAGELLHDMRLAAGLQQQDLAERIEVSASTLSLTESGRRPVTLERLQGVARALGYAAYLRIEPPGHLRGQPQVLLSFLEQMRVEDVGLLLAIAGELATADGDELTALRRTLYDLTLPF